MSFMDFINPVSGIVSGVTSIIGGIQSRNAAKDAARAQQEAAAKAGETIQAGVDKANPIVQGAADTAAAGIRGAAGEAGAGVWSATDRGNAVLDPWRITGQDANASLAELLAPGGDMSRKFTIDDFHNLDPSFDFMLGEAQKAIEKSAAARGGLQSGGTLKALTRYSADYANSKFGDAFDRFETANNNRFAKLNALSEAGRNTAALESGNLINAGTYSGDKLFGGEQIGGGYGVHAGDVQADNIMRGSQLVSDYLTQGGNAEAAGHIGSANAWNDALHGVATAAGMSLKPKAAASPTISLGQLPQTYAHQNPNLVSGYGYATRR